MVLATLAVGLIIQDIFRLVFQSNRYGVPPVFSTDPINLGPAIVTAQGLWVLGATGAVVVLLALWFRFSMHGIAMRATAQNQLGAALVGVRVDRMVALSVIIGCVLASLGGLLVAPSLGVRPEMGDILLKGFAASILGGFNSLGGAAAGGLLIGLSESVTGGYVEGYAKDVIPFVVIIVTLLIRPGGLFGRAEEMR